MQFKREKWELRQMQAMPLRLKIQMTAQRIESWYEYWDSYNIRWEDDGPPGVCLSFSGGKDSTVLRHILKITALRCMTARWCLLTLAWNTRRSATSPCKMQMWCSGLK